MFQTTNQTWLFYVVFPQIYTRITRRPDFGPLAVLCGRGPHSPSAPLSLEGEHGLISATQLFLCHVCGHL